MPEILAAVPDARLVIVGNVVPQYQARVLREARGFGISDRIIWTGYRKDVPVVMKSLDICVSAALEEALGLTMPEAMAAGRAVVATNVGGLPENVIDGETGILVPPAKPPALAEAIVRLLTDPRRPHGVGTGWPAAGCGSGTGPPGTWTASSRSSPRSSTRLPSPSPLGPRRSKSATAAWRPSPPSPPGPSTTVEQPLASVLFGEEAIGELPHRRGGGTALLRGRLLQELAAPFLGLLRRVEHVGLAPQSPTDRNTDQCREVRPLGEGIDIRLAFQM